MKKILFLNTTKLAVLSAMLLLAVFCTIGMSFTPAEEGENVGNPNDSTYVTGPRRGHWTTTSSTCGTQTNYHHLTDYGKASVTIIGNSTDEIATIGTNATHEASRVDNTLTITWNTGFGNKEHKEKLDIDKLLSDTVTFTATAGDKRIFSGWYEDADCKVKLSEDHKYSCTYTIPDASYANSKEDRNTEYEDPNNPWNGGTIYAKFIKVEPVDLTFIAPGEERGTITVTIDTENTSVTDKDVTKQNITSEVSLIAEPKEGYIFAGWYTEDSNGQVVEGTLNPSLSKIFAEDCSIGAHFVASTEATFKNITKNIEYYGLRLAAKNATSGDVIIPLKKETAVDGADLIPGTDTYTIPSGVTLLIPCDDGYSCPDEPKSLDSKPALTMYRKLTLEKGVKILVESGATLYVAGHQYGATSGNPGPGQPIGAYGAIDMNQGGEIITKGTLRAYGFILGKGNLETTGTITVDGGTVYEDFIIADMHGGGGTAACVNGTKTTNDYELFPFNQYFIQNVEPKMTLKNNAKEYAIFNIAGTQEKIELIGNNSSFLFQLHNETSTLTKWYDYERDYICYKIHGEASLNSITLEVTVLITTMTFVSSKFILPITNNMDITLTENTKMHMPNSVKLLPGSKITIEKGAIVNLQKPLYVYDMAEWDKYAMGAFAQAIKIPWHTVRDVSTKDKFEDASLVVNGTINIVESGALYTTATGGDITSTGGGKIVYNQQPASNPHLYEIYGTYGKNTSGSDLSADDAYGKKNYDPVQVFVGRYYGGKKYGIYGTPITCNPAWLHNGSIWYNGEEWKNNEWYKEGVNLEYLKTKDCDATTITYANHHWGWMEIWKDHNGTILKINNTYTKVDDLSAYTLDDLTNFVGWSTEINDTNQEVIHTAHYSYGPELDIVDADNTKNTLTINANGWASSGWPYTINDTPYEKNARQTDRTLVIPYGNKDPNEEIVIEVKDKEGTVVSCHMYKVPFVYTSDDTLSDTDENSENRIVFVKSGTLQTTDGAEAKEIYVAPGAELKVNGTLTVGKLVLRTTPWQAAVLTIGTGGSIELAEGGQVYYSRIAPNKSTITDLHGGTTTYNSARYYQFGLPLSCSISSVTMSNTGKFGESNTPYGNTWLLKSYNESKRAKNGISSSGDNWEALESTGTITAGVGYEMFSNSNYYREFYFPVNLSTATDTVSVQYTEGTKEEHNGWNIITSPLTSRANVPIIDPATAIKPCWLLADGSYTQEIPEIIPPAVPFAYQTSTADTLNFVVSTAVAAPRRQSAAEAATETEWVHLDIFNNEGRGDETSIFVHPTRFAQDYKPGIDVAKQSLTASRAILYTAHAYGDMAFAGVADSLLENGIDLVVYSPSAQELTFSLRENKFLNRLEYLWLADNETGARTDLLMDDYTFRADAGTAKGRFVLNGRFKAPQIATGIGNTQTDYKIYAIGNNIAISGVEQGTPIYVFDAVGHMIYTTTATTAEVIVPAPCAGVYMLSVGGQTAKLVINK